MSTTHKQFTSSNLITQLNQINSPSINSDQPQNNLYSSTQSGSLDAQSTRKTRSSSTLKPSVPETMGILCTKCGKHVPYLIENCCEKCRSDLSKPEPDEDIVVEINPDFDTIVPKRTKVKIASPSNEEAVAKRTRAARASSSNRKQSHGNSKMEQSKIVVKIAKGNSKTAAKMKKPDKDSLEGIKTIKDKSGTDLKRKTISSTTTIPVQHKKAKLTKDKELTKKKDSSKQSKKQSSNNKHLVSEDRETFSVKKEEDLEQVKLEAESHLEAKVDMHYLQVIASPERRQCTLSASTTTENTTEKLNDFESVAGVTNEDNKDKCTLFDQDELIREIHTNVDRKSPVHLAEEADKATSKKDTGEEGWFMLNEGFDIMIDCHLEEDDFTNIHEVRKKRDEFLLKEKDSKTVDNIESIVYPIEEVIHVGGEFQAKIPRLMEKPPVSKRVKLEEVWNPQRIDRKVYEEFVIKATQVFNTDKDKLNEENTIRLLTEYEYEADKAIKFIKSNMNTCRRRLLLRRRNCVI